MWGYGLNWPSMTLMMLGSILGIVLLVVLAWAVMRWLNQRTTKPTQQTQMQPVSGPTASEILSQRYARGEIDVTTFEQIEARDVRPRTSEKPGRGKESHWGKTLRWHDA